MKPVLQPDAGRPTPTLVMTTEGMAWLGVALLLGSVGWWKSINVVLLLAYLMLALLFINGLLARLHARRVHATREPGPPVYAGEEATVRITVTNTGRGSTTVAVEDPAGGERVAWFVNGLPPGQSTRCEGRRRFLTRGRYRGQLHISSSFPLSLLQYDRPEETAEEVLVLPAPGHADAAGLQRWLLRNAGGDGRARKVQRRVTADQADVRGVRPYRPGDPIRTIHWRSSARRHELMVREYDTAPTPDLVLIVEPWMPARPSAAHRDALEAALCLAVTIARTWCQVFGTRIVVAVAGEPDSVRSAGSADESLREALAPLAAVEGVEEFEPLAARLFDRSLARAARVVVSSRANSPYAEAMSFATRRRFETISPADQPVWYHAPFGDRG